MRKSPRLQSAQADQCKHLKDFIRVMAVLGIESSCDETAVAVYCPQRGLLAEALRSQVDIHAEYGGVVPELASRDHIRHLPRLVRKALAESGVPGPELDAVAYTAGPGLIGALLAGAAVAAGLAQAWGRPLIPVHHMEGHLLAPLIAGDAVDFPFLALLVSGGHTLLIECRALGDYQVLGQTLDDAVGEAFDKTASLLDLPYPGGPALAALAAQGQPGRFALPRPLTSKRSLDFSFSGLKTAAMLLVRDTSAADRADIARAFEDAVVDTLVKKCLWALADTGLRTLFVAGGVAANQSLRQQLQVALEPQGAQVLFPPPALCTDNGAMIAHVGSLRLAQGRLPPCEVPTRARWSLADLEPPA